MARNKKVGLDYFPFDRDFFENDKIQLISAELGLRGESIFIRLLCRVYKHGYFCTFTEDMAMLFAKNIGDGVTVEELQHVVDVCIKRNLFDKSMHEQYGILTSRGIQNQFIRICKGANRKFEIEPKYDLTDLSKLKNILYERSKNISSEEKGISSEEISNSQEETTHLLGDEYTKERKGKEIKGKEKELRDKTIANEIWIEDTAMAYSSTPAIVSAFCEAWIPKAVARTLLEQYPVNKLIGFMIVDFEKEKISAKKESNGSTAHTDRIGKTNKPSLDHLLNRRKDAHPAGEHDTGGNQYAGA